MFEIITNSELGSGDYVIIKKDGQVVVRGHSVSLREVALLLEAKVTQVTDDEMEELC